MKFVLRDLKVGDRLQAKVEELLAGDDVLLNFDGDLLRVHNETLRPLQPNEVVTVIVKAIDPLQFQLFTGQSSARRLGHIDYSV